MKKFLYKIWSKFLTFFGDIKCFKYPLFLVYDPDDFQISGEDTIQIMNILKPGDIILRGYNRYLDSKFIDFFGISTNDSVIGGKWSHGAIYIGNGEIIHAVAEGVSKTNVVEFTRCDRIAIFRPKKHTKTAISKAKQFLKKKTPYDFGFKYDVSALYCFELCGESYDKLNIPRYDIRKFFGVMRKDKVFLAKSFIESPDMSLVFVSNEKFDKHK